MVSLVVVVHKVYTKGQRFQNLGGSFLRSMTIPLIYGKYHIGIHLDKL